MSFVYFVYFYLWVLLKCLVWIQIISIVDVLAQIFGTQNKATADQNDSDANSYEKTCFEDKVHGLPVFN